MYQSLWTTLFRESTCDIFCCHLSVLVSTPLMERFQSIAPYLLRYRDTGAVLPKKAA